MGQIEARGLVRTFGEVRAVDGVDLVVRPGGLTGFVGGNGAGKTTTMRMVMGLLRPDAGRGALGRPPDDRRRPTPVRLHARGARALPQAEGRRPARLPRPALGDDDRGRPRGGRRATSSASTSASAPVTASRRSASATSSGCRSSRPCSTGRRPWCSTSRSAGSTRPRSTRWPTSCATTRHPGCPCCSAATSSTSWSGSATTSSCWPAAGSSRRARSTTCAPAARPATGW